MAPNNASNASACNGLARILSSVAFPFAPSHRAHGGALQLIEPKTGRSIHANRRAKARAAETLHLVSNEMVQMHGGIGMTDAHDAGLYLKRARVAEGLYGGAAFHRDRYATINGY